MIITIVALVAALGVILLIGDRVGMAISRRAPMNEAGAGAAVQATFDEPIDPESVGASLSISPAVSGKISVSENTVSFLPSQPLTPGQTYTARVNPGIRARTGRPLLQGDEWTFQVRMPLVAYLAPDNGIVLNLFIVNPAKPETPRQITQSDKGLLSYDILPDGSRIVYAQLEDRGMASLYVYDTRTDTSSVLLKCDKATCNNPTWRADGKMVAYERAEFNPDVGIGPGAPRIWVLDLTNNSTRPLFSDNQRLGYTPRFSSDGEKLAMYDAGQGGIVVYDFKSDKDRFIETPQGEVGKFSPDSRWIFFPRIVQAEDGSYVSYFVLVDLNSDVNMQRDLVPDVKGASDVDATWMPDSSGLIVLRRMPGPERMTRGQQLFAMDLATGKSKALVTDDSYANGQMDMSANRQIVMRRTQLGKPGVQSEIWVYAVDSGDFKRITINAALPRWMP